MTVAEQPGLLSADEAAWLDRVLGVLDQPLDPSIANVLKDGGGKGATYIEAHIIIEQANKIFGRQNWGYQVTATGFHPVGAKGGGVFWALVTVTIKGFVACTDIGTCDVIVGADKAGPVNAQIEMALKGAASRGVARALRAKGDQFGLGLYDKDSDIHQQIRAAVAQQDQAKRSGAVRPVQRPPSQPLAPQGARPAQTPAQTPVDLPRAVAPKTRERALGSDYWRRGYGKVRELLRECGHASGLDKWETVRSYIETETGLSMPASLWDVSIDNWATLVRKLDDKLGRTEVKGAGPTPQDGEAHYNRLLLAARNADDEGTLAGIHNVEQIGEADTLHQTGVLTDEQYNDVTTAVVERFDWLGDHPI